MNILSLPFLVLTAFLIIFYYSFKKYQVYLLIIFSILFYSFEGFNNTIIALGIIILDYFLIKKIINFKKHRQISFLLLIIFNFLPLFITKYLLLTISVVNKLFNTNIPVVKLVPPLGISFLTFIVIANLFDIYRSKRVNFTFIKFIFVNFFFPQTTSGPITRGVDLHKQISNKKKIESFNIYLGLNLIATGIFQKIVISNRLGVYVDVVFNSLPTYLGFPLLIAIYFFTLQIYLDFLSYTNIARGLAKLFGYDLAINFKFPYFSKSISDFWSRWHISLSSWFRDYVYIPLGGSRVQIHRIFLNILITFVLSGLWHGAGINFIIWGFLNGIFVFADRLLNLNKKVRSFFENKYISFIRMFITFNLLTLLWVLFRSINLSQAIYIYKNIFNLANYRSGIISILENTNIFEHLELSILVTIPYILYEIICYSKIKLPSRFSNSIILRYSFYIILFLTLIFLGYFGKQDFYYAKF